MKDQDKALIIFMRFPEMGKVKSRLASSIGWQQSMEVYLKLARRTLGLVSEFKVQHPEIDIYIFFTPSDRASDMKEAFPGPWFFVPQNGTHLGSRMSNAFQTLFKRGYGQVLMVGTDIADLQTSDFEAGFEALKSGCSALGPATDGGFYLIGLKSPCSLPFETERWGTNDVFFRTFNLLEVSGHRVRITQERQDIDRPEDLQFLHLNPLFLSSLSVIVPTLQSPHALEPWITSLKRQLWPGDEIIISRGSGTPRIIRSSTDHVHQLWLESPPGRGIQLKEGARHAAGCCLLFLHDDSEPPANFAYHIRKALLNRSVSLGCFELSFRPSTAALDAIAKWANFRSRHLRLPYGDQGLFCRNEIYTKVGGMRELFIMEDVDLVRRCRRLGKVAVLPFTMRTSPKRYHTRGVLRASIENHMVMASYLLGIDNRKIYSFYYRSHLSAFKSPSAIASTQ